MFTVLKRSWAYALAVLMLGFAAVPATAAAAPAGGPQAAVSAPHTELARLSFGGRGYSGGSRGFFGGRSRGFFGGRRGFFGGRSRGRGFFRRVLHALALGYLLHLLFTTPGGLLVLLLMVGLVVWLMSRLRRRRTFGAM